MRRLGLFLLLLASGAAGFLISNSKVGNRYVRERVPGGRRPVNVLVDTEAVPGVANPLGVAQDLMNQWNAINEAEDVFGFASQGGPYNATTAGDTFGRFTDSQFEVAWDDTGEILQHFGVGTSVLGITLKSVDNDRGEILDFLVVVNTRPGFLVAPGTGASAEELFRATLIHELGHAVGLGHSPVGMANPQTFGIGLAAPSQIPSMFPFRLPPRPQEGAIINGDDVAALTRSYPEDVSGLGSISGTVRSASGVPINDIAIRAIGPAGVGEQHVGIVTNEDASGEGRFTIPCLPPGAYRVLVEAINGRGSVTGFSLAGNGDGLGSNPFVMAVDEFWQPGDSWSSVSDVPTDFTFVQVRAGADTGGIDFVLNGQPLGAGQDQTVNETLDNGDAVLPDDVGGFHYVDYYVFQATSGAALTFDVNTNGVIPQLQLLRPSDLRVTEEDLPTSGRQATIAATLSQTGLFTLAVSARATTGNSGGRGTYSLRVTGTVDPLPTVAPATVAAVQRGPLDPPLQQVGSPARDMVMLQLRLVAPRYEELWVDAMRLRASGSANDFADVDTVALVHDLDGDGEPGSGEPVLATAAFVADNGVLQLSNLGLQVDAGGTADVLVVYDVDVQSVSSTTMAGFPAWWFLPLLAPLVLLRRRAVLLALLLALLPLSCGGGGGAGGPAGNPDFDPGGAIVDFQVSLEANGVEAYTSTSDPSQPLTGLVPAAIPSSTLEVSN